jgi:uncharacterized protein (DUF2147 family)
MRLAPAVASMLVATVAASLAQVALVPDGTWLTADNTAKIRFESCAGVPCGRLVWLRDPLDPKTGEAILDRNNPDPALRARRLLGIPLITDIRPLAPGEWSARAYDAEDAGIYDIILKLVAADRLAVRGCGLAGLICKTELWTKSQ